MTIEYCIDSERDLILVEGRGSLDFEDLREFRAKLIKDPLFHDGMKELGDFRPVEHHDFTMEGFQHFLDQERSYIDLFRESRIAIVTHSDLLFGFARMYMARMNDLIPNVQVFREMDKAKEWLLNVPEQATTINGRSSKT